jgi:hypothetical protein
MSRNPGKTALFVLETVTEAIRTVDMPYGGAEQPEVNTGGSGKETDRRTGGDKVRTPRRRSRDWDLIL